MSKSLIIVESPTKAKTIQKFLGNDFDIKASFGHVRDLPNNASEIPAELKKEKWTRVGINIEDNFEPLYIIPEDKKKYVKDLKDSLKSAEQVFLATDEDREGESISWHLLEVLKPKIPVKRLVFHEITKEAIQHSLKNARQVDQNLVKAQETRRIVDRLFGYLVSPLLWKKMAPKLSAGRVQSVATRLLVERERERINFTSAVYWDLTAVFTKENSPTPIEGQIVSVNGKRIAGSKDFNPQNGALTSHNEILHLDKEKALELKARLLAGTPKVKNVEEKPFSTKPYPPFTTSTLQQEANRKLGFAVKRTMQIAQNLYENGYITYMRTDSTTLSEEAIKASRELVAREYGNGFLPSSPRVYTTKVKNAQEAHEAIRPAGSVFPSLSTIKEKLGVDAYKLYELIWKRTIASQMKDAEGTRITVQIALEDAIFRASGKTISFSGFLRAYVEGSDDPQADLADKEKILPPLVRDETLVTKELSELEHETQPPQRYTEGSIIKELERLGIGRPSTWATIVDVILSRGYAKKKGNALVPSFLAMALTGLMERFFFKVIDYEFTANLEEDLDSISRGESDNLQYLKSFYFGERPGLELLVKQGEEKIDPRDVCGLPLGITAEGKQIEVRIGRFGPFLTDGERRSSVPDICPDELTLDAADKVLSDAASGPLAIGINPDTQRNIYIKKGRFGPYIQEGDDAKDAKLASLLPGMVPEEVDLQIALKILSLPRTLGVFPANNEEIVAANGRYGPYIKCGSETRSLPQDISPIYVTLEHAIELLLQPKQTRVARAKAQNTELRKLGKIEETGVELVIKNGRYGPYITNGKVNASLPRQFSVEDITFDQAKEIIIEKEKNAPVKPVRAKRAAKVASNDKAAKDTEAGSKSTKKKTPAVTAKSTKKKSDVGTTSSQQKENKPSSKTSKKMSEVRKVQENEIGA
jgi:DNA topoisomerase I